MPFFGSLFTSVRERQQIMYMLSLGFFMGVFIATYQITADSLFLNRMGDQLNKAFLLSGVLGIIITGTFSWLQNYIRFSRLTTVMILLVLLFTLSVYILLHSGSPEWQRLVIFGMYSASGPVIAVLLLSYWGTFGRLFNFRQSKRIIGWIDTGQLIAAILASFLIPLTVNVVPETVDYLVLCQASLVVMALLQVAISYKFSLIKNDPKEIDEEVRRQTGVRKMFSDRYILQLSSLVLISMMVYIFTQFSFQEIAKEQYPDERPLTDFMAVIIGMVYVISLLMQTFVNNRIISNYGVKVSLLALPVIVIVFSVASVLSGFFLGYNKALHPDGFIYFFLFVAITRVFNWTLRDSLETPLLKLLFIPLDNRYRFGLQARVEGMVNESSRFISGLLVFGLTALPFYKIIHFPLFLVFFGVVYILVINRLYNGYRNKVREKLERSGQEQKKLEQGFERLSALLEKRLAEETPGKAIFAFKFLEKYDFSMVGAWVGALMKNPDESVRSYAQEKLNELKGLSVSDQYVIRLNPEKSDTDSKTLLGQSEIRQIIENNGEISKLRIQSLARSSISRDRQYAAELILHTSGDECISFLCELLQDPDPRVRITAIKSTIKKYNQDVVIALIDNLNNPLHSTHALNALVRIGQYALPLMDISFYKSGQSTQTLHRIVQAMGKIGGPRAWEFLWNKIDYPDKTVAGEVLHALGLSGFKANINQVSRIQYIIENDIADIRWNLGAIQEVKTLRNSAFIIDSLREEIERDLQQIYMLLAMLYDTHSIQLVKENVESGTTEGIAYAIELLDVFLPEQLKQRIIPVLDELTDEERIAKLDVFYPRARLDARLTLKFLLNRDFVQTSRWTKASVLFYIGSEKIEEFKMDVIAHLFNPDRLINEVAGWALYQINPSEYRENIKRLGPVKMKLINDVVRTDQMSTFTRTRFLKNLPMFRHVPLITLTNVADYAEEQYLEKSNTIMLDEHQQHYFFIVTDGELQLFCQGAWKQTFTKGDFIGEFPGIPGFLQTNVLQAISRCRLLRIHKERFYELMTNHIQLASTVLEAV
jgi:hypothetical protein